ncbi:MAG: hypothetical protein ACSLEZ_03435 [Thiobacillus sp.]
MLGVEQHIGAVPGVESVTGRFAAVNATPEPPESAPEPAPAAEDEPPHKG